MIAPDTLLQNRYLVQTQIGQGGMGAVYVATDQRFGSTVALKETFFDDANLRKAFEREARLLNHLRHPALPRVSDHFMEEDGQFLVMEFIPGADLAETLKEKGVPFPLSDVLDWADQLLDALDYLHTHEPPVIHRDIKPQNLKLTPRGHIVLLDFGLAKGTPLQASRVTATGSIVGYSFHYAPLEQMQGTGTDPRSDLYSLGATLYHLLTGSPPPDALTRATAVLNGEADPLRPASEVHKQVPAPVARVLMSAMAQSAAKRPQTATEMREALREASKQSEAADQPTIIQPISATALHEQDTQLIGAPTGIAADAATNIKEAGTAAGLHEAATVIQQTPAASKASSATTHNRAEESVVTKVRADQAHASKPWLSGRVMVAALSVVLLAVGAAALYKFVQQPPPQSPSIQPATVAPTSQTATPEPSAPESVEDEKPAPSPESQPTPEPTQQASGATNKTPKRKPTTAARPPDEENDMGDEPNTPPEVDEQDLKNSGLSPEERAKIIEDVRRAKQQAREGERQRRDALRQARQQQLQQQRQQQQRERARRRGAPPPGTPPQPPY
jgi:serine/threonine protein kinase